MAPEPGLYGRCGLEGPHHDQRLGHGGASGVGVRDDAPELPRRGTRPAAGVQRPQHSVIAGRRRRGRVGREREDRDPRLHDRRLDGIDVQLRGGGLGSVGHVPAGTAGVPHPSAVRRLLRRSDDDGEPGVRQRLPEHGAGRGVRLPARPAALGLWPDVREYGRRSDRCGDRRLRLGDDRRRRDPLLQHLRADRAVLGGQLHTARRDPVRPAGALRSIRLAPRAGDRRRVSALDGTQCPHPVRGRTGLRQRPVQRRAGGDRWRPRERDHELVGRHRWRPARHSVGPGRLGCAVHARRLDRDHRPVLLRGQWRRLPDLRGLDCRLSRVQPVRDVGRRHLVASRRRRHAHR